MYPLIIGGIAVTCLVLVTYTTLPIRQKIKHGIHLSNHLNLILDHCQRHSGATNTYVQGNAKLIPQLISLQSDVKGLISCDESLLLKDTNCLLRTSWGKTRQQQNGQLNIVGKRLHKYGQFEHESHGFFTLSSQAIDDVLKMLNVPTQYASQQNTPTI